ncbi:Hypothetical predicted protein [Octopus vulgaris]|uniref:Uncharacterized protein n=1 Tax=Octopus vulgaris TaxID=6645 RepID=A0AA36F6T6_OCTVU|nr:Hypothetical predicted protein [Octopus vulgaris]
MGGLRRAIQIVSGKPTVFGVMLKSQGVHKNKKYYIGMNKESFKDRFSSNHKLHLQVYHNVDQIGQMKLKPNAAQ